MLKLFFAGATLALMAGSAGAETFEVRMLNRGETGVMVFEPAHVKAAPGDVIHFVATDAGHNVESIDGMLPDGAAAFKSPLGEDFSLTVAAEGLYGVKCTPHYTLGMVALIEVGAPANLDEVRAVKHKGKARKVFAGLLAGIE